MANLVAMLKQRQGDKTPEVFAVNMNIAPSTLRAYYKSTREIGRQNARKMIAYFEKQKDNAMVDAIRRYYNEKTALD